MTLLPRMALVPQERRRMAVMLALEGEPPEQVADVLGVSERSVWRWLGAFHSHGDAGLLTRPGQGRPPKLSDAQARRVLGWLEQSPGAFGFVTERWTAARRVSHRAPLRRADEPPVSQRLALAPRPHHPAGARATRPRARRGGDPAVGRGAVAADQKKVAPPPPKVARVRMPVARPPPVVVRASSEVSIAGDRVGRGGDLGLRRGDRVGKTVDLLAQKGAQ